MKTKSINRKAHKGLRKGHKKKRRTDTEVHRVVTENLRENQIKINVTERTPL